MARQAASKYDVVPQLFKPEPPMEPRQIRRLFSGRTRELARGLAALQAGLDIKGKRSGRYDKRPWVIHGESRSGKSHLARRIFAELPDDKQRLQFVIAAGGRLDALTVVRELFEQIRGRFTNRILDPALAYEPFRTAEVQLVKQLVEKVGLFESGVQAATLSVEESAREVNDLGFELGGGTRLAKFIAKFQTEHSQKAAVQLSLRPPTAVDLAEVCGIMAETLLQRQLVRHVLILMDDVDLLEGYVSPQQNARAQRSLLADAIRVLHSTPGVDVVLTARSWYAHSQKELQTLVDLAMAESMIPDEMLSIFDLRLKAYAPENPMAAFLTREALRQLASDVDGLPGVFLQHLQSAFYQFQNDDDPSPRDYDWLLGFFRNDLTRIREKCVLGYRAITEAINDGRLTVDVGERNPFFGTMLENEYAYQSYYSETTYFISPLIRKVLTVSPIGSP